MKYTTEEELAEIKKRSKRVIYKNNQRSVSLANVIQVVMETKNSYFERELPLEVFRENTP